MKPVAPDVCPVIFANTNTIDVINVVGSFNTGEKVSTTSSAETDEILENSSNADLTISAVVTNTFDKVKQVFMDDPDSGQDFSADTVLDTSFSLSGTVSTAGFVTMFRDMRKPTVELNLEPSSNQEQFDFAIHKPATVAVEEFKNLLLKNLKN